MNEPNYSYKDAKGVICENLVDLSSVHVNREVEVDELMMRYGGASGMEKSETSDSGIQIFRPDHKEVVARYASISFQTEPDIEDEIILNHPDDDDVVKRYASYFLSQNNKEELDSAESFEVVATNDDDTCNATVATSVGSPSPPPPHIDIHSNVAPRDDDDMSDFDPPVLENETERGPIPSNESCTDMSDLERINPVTPSRLSEEESDSSTGLDEIALSSPDCSSHKRSITFYNLCCNKEIFSSISIDSPMKDGLRAINHRRSGTRNGVPDSYEANGDYGRYARKIRNRNQIRPVTRKDNLISVIYKIERIAQTMETRCIEARRSLRRNASQENFAKVGSNLKTDLTPLLNTSISLLMKVRSN